MIKPLHDTDPNLVWRSQIPQGSRDWYFAEAHRTERYLATLHLFHYQCDMFGIFPIWNVRHVKSWEDLSLSYDGRPEPDMMDIKDWMGKREDFLEDVLYTSFH
jgi:hypothetical protein